MKRTKGRNDEYKVFRLDEVGELAANALPAWVRLGRDYLDEKTFYEAISDPERHRPLPYTLRDVQMQIERALSGGMEPEEIWELYAKVSTREWAAIVNHTILHIERYAAEAPERTVATEASES